MYPDLCPPLRSWMINITVAAQQCARIWSRFVESSVPPRVTSTPIYINMKTDSHGIAFCFSIHLYVFPLCILAESSLGSCPASRCTSKHMNRSHYSTRTADWSIISSRLRKRNTSVREMILDNANAADELKWSAHLRFGNVEKNVVANGERAPNPKPSNGSVWFHTHFPIVLSTDYMPYHMQHSLFLISVTCVAEGFPQIRCFVLPADTVIETSTR